MRLLQTLLSPPTLFFISLQSFASGGNAEELIWPYNLPPHVKYYPEHEALAKRHNEILRRMSQQQPRLVKKMSADPSEMFLLDYWAFEEEDHPHLNTWTNISIAPKFDLPAPLHSNFYTSSQPLLKRYLRWPNSAAELFAKRDFVCPTGTNACTSINRPNVCCPSSSTCQIVRDTGLGDVGCCNAAQTCAGSLSQCPSGYTGCPVSQGGGCCLPGYACFQEGCVQTSTVVVVVSPTQSPTTSSTTSTSSATTVTDTTTVVVTTQPGPNTVTRTETITNIPTGSTVTSLVTSMATSTSTPNSLICSSGFRSCPASLGGGCCPSDRACARDACPEVSSTDSLDAPVRGTSSSSSATSTDNNVGCPTGFYACSAYYPGGCCQVDRDCQSTSCPAKTGVTVVNTGSVTVVAPTGTSVGLLTGVCAGGWSTCDQNVGGGCCPTGYACGTMACTASGNGMSATQGKIAPNGAERMWGSTRVGVACSLGVLFGVTFLLA